MLLYHDLNLKRFDTKIDRIFPQLVRIKILLPASENNLWTYLWAFLHPFASAIELFYPMAQSVLKVTIPMAATVYRQRESQNSPYYRCVEDRFEAFERVSEERFELH